MIVSTVLRGGIGNCFFCVATALAYCFKHNVDYCLIPTKIENPHYTGQKVFYSPFLNYTDIDQSINTTVYKEPFFHYQEIPKFNCEKLVLNGYWQSEKFFVDYRNEIISILNIPYRFDKGYCSIQVRRGDYIKYPNIHPPINNEYLGQAQILMREKGIRDFEVFSDDIDWCMDSMVTLDGCNYGFSTEKDELKDLISASSCEHNIGSNSSYAWWIYWLNQNENKIGIFPRTWFGECMNHDTKDLYMPQMILM